MADALISVVVEQLAPFLLEKLKKEVKLVLGAPEDVQELHDTFDKIRDILDDAEKRHVKNVLHNLEKNEIKKVPESAWLEKLKDVSYEMEDVLDEWRTKILKSEIAADGVDGARTGKKKVLPALGRLEFLECLKLFWLDSVSQIGLEVLGVLNSDISAPVIAFPNLKELSIDNMKHWEEWVIQTTVDIIVMPLLQKLTISSCPLLKSLPCQILSSSLREIKISGCPHLEFSYLPPFLEKLKLCDDAGSLSISLPIQNGLHSNLKSLAILGLPHSTLPQGLSQLKALQTLKVYYCNFLSSMSEELQHLTSLQRLKIKRCPILEPRCQKEVGEDWSIISHIPNIHINSEKIQ
ncbi:hypothetical protein GIB67_040841 [Kingdonia uniflora]|uniref:Disease resistance N-terminal domain-containing protein n=1 Tax=Kingdonia uniflora TaxID=39325 RepID=A0A7J7P594_9MAGN|nr:hypothetical protein GIB67_040841 [Kingdonia uniflora]